MYPLSEIPGRTAMINGLPYLYFSGTDYLGMGHLPEFQELVHEGLRKYGLHFGGSRLSSVRFNIFDQAESFLARLGQAEAALTLSSGTVAGQLVAKCFEQESSLHYAPESHPALRSAMANTYPTRESWERAVLELSHQSGPPLIAFTDAVDALRVRFFDFSWSGEIGTKREVVLVIDDSHTWGLTGEKGGASYTLIDPPAHVELITLGSLGKAFGVPAGFVMGRTDRIQALGQSPFFGGASPTLPAFLYAMVGSETLYQKQRDRLAANARMLQEQLPAISPFRYYADYPLFHTAAHRLASYLFRHQILISSFPYPRPDSELATRIVLNGLHTSEDVGKLGELVRAFFEDT